MSKKIIVLLAFVGILAVAGVAFAHWGGGPGPQRWVGNQQLVGCWAENMGRMAFGGGYLRGAPVRRGDLSIYPEEIVDKMNELHRANLKLRLAMIENKPDEQKIRSLFEKSEQLRKEIQSWRFEQLLKARTQSGQ